MAISSETQRLSASRGSPRPGLLHLQGLANLRSLSLNSTNINGSGLVHLKELTQLTDLNLEGTKITDAELAHLKEFGNLKLLTLYNTDITERAVSELRAALPGCSISHSRR